MDKTILKFRCDEKAYRKHWKGDGLIGHVTLIPVVSEGGEGENAAFYEATPSGKVEFGTINEDALEMFEPGLEYYIEIRPAEQTS